MMEMEEILSGKNYKGKGVYSKKDFHERIAWDVTL